MEREREREVEGVRERERETHTHTHTHTGTDRHAEKQREHERDGQKERGVGGGGGGWRTDVRSTFCIVVICILRSRYRDVYVKVTYRQTNWAKTSVRGFEETTQRNTAPLREIY